MHQKLLWIQSRFVGQITQIEAKLKVLNMFWDLQIKEMIDGRHSKDSNKAKKKKELELIHMSMKLSP